MKTSNDLIITCPLCGFSYNIIDLKSSKKIKKCPMCGYKLNDKNNFPTPPENLKRRII